MEFACLGNNHPDVPRPGETELNSRGGGFLACQCSKPGVSSLTDSRDLGGCWPVSLGTGEAERLSGTGVAETEGAGGETLSHLPKRDEVPTLQNTAKIKQNVASSYLH